MALSAARIQGTARLLVARRSLVVVRWGGRQETIVRVGVPAVGGVALTMQLLTPEELAAARQLVCERRQAVACRVVGLLRYLPLEGWRSVCWSPSFRHVWLRPSGLHGFRRLRTTGWVVSFELYGAGVTRPPDVPRDQTPRLARTMAEERRRSADRRLLGDTLADIGGERTALAIRNGMMMRARSRPRRCCRWRRSAIPGTREALWRPPSAPSPPRSSSDQGSSPGS